MPLFSMVAFFAAVILSAPATFLAAKPHRMKYLTITPIESNIYKDKLWHIIANM
jgi:hypothetical protein